MFRFKNWLSLAIVLSTLGCSQSQQVCTLQQNESITLDADPRTCEMPQAAQGALYEIWDGQNGLAHFYRGGILFDVGTRAGGKYLARSAATSWLSPEFITSTQAKTDNLGWAADRYVRWLASTAGTIHFPFYPDEWPGELYVEVGLRPKMNASMAIRFYKPNDKGEREWSEPLTTDLTPGWHGYRWKVPREYLSKDGMQMMRVSFPGTFFEGENRVSAKFVHIGFGQLGNKTGRFQLEAPNIAPNPMKHRVLSHELMAWSLKTRDRLDRFFVVPQRAKLHFYAAPAAWLRTPGILKVEAQTDTTRKTLGEYTLTPGDCWTPKTVDLSEFGGKAVRLSLNFVTQDDKNGDIFTSSEEFRPDILISEPEIRLPDEGKWENARQILRGAQKVVVLAVDNLRADRIWVPEKRRAVPGIAHLADEGIQGILMGGGRSHIALTTSFLTTEPTEVHQVRDTTTHVRSSLTTLAEAVGAVGWKSHFYSTTGMVDSAKGFAQGFDHIHALNKTPSFDTASALNEVANALKVSPDQTLFYVHLSELRLPHRGSNARMDVWGIPGYNGPVNATSMQNTLVMANPSSEDAEQFEAYYDSELADIDAEIAQFAAGLDGTTALIVLGTHGTSLGEAALGYEQGLTPWELMTPYLIYMPEKRFALRHEQVIQAQTLSASILDMVGALPEGKKTLFEPHDARPVATADGLTVTATLSDFYRIRREGVDALFTTGLNGETAARLDIERPITKRSMREKIQ